MSELWLVRHAQASLFAEDYDQLSELGQSQARMLGTFWRSLPVPPTFDQAFCGPAKRHRHTAELALSEFAHPASSASTDVLDRFDEHDGETLTRQGVRDLAGDDEITGLVSAIAGLGHAPESRPARSKAYQRLFAAVMRRWLDGEYTPAGVESWAAFESRVLEGLDELVQRTTGARRVVLFTSVGPTAVLLRRALQLDPHGAYALAYRQRNASVSRFLYSGTRFGLDGYNEFSHLPDPDHQTFR